MPGDVFYWLFNMSLTATLTGMIVLLLRRLRKIPRRVIVLLWVIPFLRLWIPVGIGGKYGLMSLISRFTTKTVVLSKEDFITLSVINHTMGADSYFPIVYKINLLERVYRIAFGAWISVFSLLLVILCILYFTALREMKNAVPFQVGVYLSDRVSGPAVYGILRPKIVLPTKLSESDLTYILMHERAHMRHYDNLWRMVGFVTAAMHWFNPVVWVFLKCFLCDLELACDERVLSKCTVEQKRGYALSLLNVKEKGITLASAFGGAKLKVRIGNILSYRKLSVLSVMGFALLILVCTYVLLTNAP